MAERSINGDVGLFGPESMIWRVNREAVVALAGTCAILMQFAHPKVVAGVKDHSNFQADPTGRLRRTFDLSLAWVFGSRDEALDAARIVNRRHDSVRGADYSAMDPELLMWVQATLVYAAIKAYRCFVGPLRPAEADRYYQDTKRIGVLLGIPPAMYPPDVEHFERYLQSMIDRGQVSVNDDALRLGSIVLAPHFLGVPRVAFAPLKTITAGLLPPELRRQYGLGWGRSQRALFGACQIMFPRLLPLMPPAIRYLPPARRAYRRLTLQTADANQMSS